jgi:hypothetical protein
MTPSSRVCLSKRFSESRDKFITRKELSGIGSAPGTIRLEQLFLCPEIRRSDAVSEQTGARLCTQEMRQPTRRQSGKIPSGWRRVCFSSHSCTLRSRRCRACKGV